MARAMTMDLIKAAIPEEEQLHALAAGLAQVYR